MFIGHDFSFSLQISTIQPILNKMSEKIFCDFEIQVTMLEKMKKSQFSKKKSQFSKIFQKKIFSKIEKKFSFKVTKVTIEVTKVTIEVTKVTI